MLSSTPNPFVRGFDTITFKRELLITYDDSYVSCYRQLLPHQEALADEDIVGHSCFFNDSHALLSEPEAISAELSERYPADGTVRTVVYPVRAIREGEEVHVADTESPERAQALIDLLSFETGFYSRAFEISCAHLPEDEWTELQDLVQHADNSLLLFEHFELPDSDAIGFKLHGTPWTETHLDALEGHGLGVLQAKQLEEGFPEQFVRVLGLAGQADVRLLILDPNASVLKGLPIFDE